MPASLALAMALATGPSFATYRIVPVAASQRGVVLFRTWRELNPTGAHTVHRVDVGWLAVSEKGLWREAPHARLEPDGMTDAAAFHEIARLRDEFEAPLDWRAPPASVRPILVEFGLRRRDAIEPAAGTGLATWSPDQACVRRTCAPRVRQRTIGGHASDDRAGTPVESAFFRSGIAVFRNRLDPEHAERGARFRLPPNTAQEPGLGRVDVGYHIVEVDGIAILGSRPTTPNAP